MLLSRKFSRIHNRVQGIKVEIAEQEALGILRNSQRRIIERCVLQLQIEMEVFVRNYILDCATGRYFHSSGRVKSTLAYPFENREAAYHYLIKSSKSSREPQWIIPKNAIDAANTLSLTNIPHIAAELGIVPWELDDLRFVRNFIAHNSKDTALKLRKHNLASRASSIDPVAIAIAASPRGGKNYERWAGFILGVASRLVT